MTALRMSVMAVMALFVVMALPACAQDNAMLRDEIHIKTKNGKDLVYNVELAMTPAQQERGLMERTTLDENAGMLFVFPSEALYTFWMKNTLIPLDMLFIARDGTIVHIHHMAKPQDETHITTDTPALAVLEINGGQADALGLAEGDVVVHSLFGNTNKLAP